VDHPPFLELAAGDDGVITLATISSKISARPMPPAATAASSKPGSSRVRTVRCLILRSLPDRQRGGFPDAPGWWRSAASRPGRSGGPPPPCVAGAGPESSAAPRPDSGFSPRADPPSGKFESFLRPPPRRSPVPGTRKGPLAGPLQGALPPGMDGAVPCPGTGRPAGPGWGTAPDRSRAPFEFASLPEDRPAGSGEGQ